MCFKTRKDLNTYINIKMDTYRQSKTQVETRWEKCVVQNVTQLLLLRHLLSWLCTIIQKRHVISHRHLTEGTGAPEAGLILQRSMILSPIQKLLRIQF